MNPFTDMLRFASGELLPVQRELRSPDAAARALARDRREAILSALADGPSTTREIAAQSGLTTKQLWERLARMVEGGELTYDGTHWAVKRDTK
jgi:predicted Rossmann fold nucleotide-binding protein DprA/Smf involved in DNA uptake